MHKNANGSSGSSVWNKEHVMPQSWYTGKYGNLKGDLHNLRISNAKINSDRGSDKFTTGKGKYLAKSNGGFYPGDDHIGDVARISMYMMTIIPDVITINRLLTNGSIQTLLEWHEIDPVDDFEIKRNDVIFKYQLNRNPFIDNPDFANLIWGTQTRQTLSVVESIIDNLTYEISLENISFKREYII